MQFQVPQFIETEDKIIGPLTLKQFIYLAVAGGISFLMYLMLQSAVLWFVLASPIIALGVSLAFLKINGQPFPKILSSAFEYYWGAQTYVWQPENPELPKTEENLKEVLGEKFSVEKILQGMALKSAWRYIQTGSKPAPQREEPQKKSMEKFQVFRSMTGEKRAARRVDYR